jgi:hypothetical protein
MRQPLTDSLIMEDIADKVFTGHGGREYRVEHTGFGIWKIVTAGAQPSMCETSYTTCKLAQDAITNYLFHTTPKPKVIFETTAMEKRRLRLEREALAESENN